MPTGPIDSPPRQPKKSHGVVDDDAPIDDYENAVYEREHEDVHRLADEPNGGTGSQNRSKSGH
ncbi:hypothetical protein BDW62DRAFT_198857 [Aspergillus aurantiobrunneus]